VEVQCQPLIVRLHYLLRRLLHRLCAHPPLHSQYTHSRKTPSVPVLPRLSLRLPFPPRTMALSAAAASLLRLI
jgi:hypothetical protein